MRAGAVLLIVALVAFLSVDVVKTGFGVKGDEATYVSMALSLALPGHWWLTRQKPKIAFLSALTLLALLLPAAGKTLVQTTLMRLIVAAVSFGAMARIELLARRNRALPIAFGLLAVVSLDNALAYSLQHYRHMDTLVDRSSSEWKVNPLFPPESTRSWQISAANGSLLMGWIVVVLSRPGDGNPAAVVRLQKRRLTDCILLPFLF